MYETNCQSRFGARYWKESVTDYTTPSSSLPNTVATNNAKMEDTLVNNVPLPSTLPLPKMETKQQSSSLTSVPPTTFSLTFKSWMDVRAGL